MRHFYTQKGRRKKKEETKKQNNKSNTKDVPYYFINRTREQLGQFKLVFTSMPCF